MEQVGWMKRIWKIKILSVWFMTFNLKNATEGVSKMLTVSLLRGRWALVILLAIWSKFLSPLTWWSDHIPSCLLRTFSIRSLQLSRNLLNPPYNLRTVFALHRTACPSQTQKPSPHALNSILHSANKSNN